MSSLSFVHGIWSGDGNAGRKAKAGEGSIDCTPPDYIMPKSKERPLLPLHPNLADNKVCIGEGKFVDSYCTDIEFTIYIKFRIMYSSVLLI